MEPRLARVSLEETRGAGVLPVGGGAVWALRRRGRAWRTPPRAAPAVLSFRGPSSGLLFKEALLVAGSPAGRAQTGAARSAHNKPDDWPVPRM